MQRCIAADRRDGRRDGRRVGLGAAFFSKDDCAAQSVATAFSSRDDCNKFIQDFFPDMADGIVLHAVTPDQQDGYISVQALHEQGFAESCGPWMEDLAQYQSEGEAARLRSEGRRMS